MAGVAFTIEAEGVEEMLASVAGLFHGLVNLSPLMQRFAAYLELSTVERFATNIAPSGAAWRPSLRVQLHGGQTLVQRGILRDSLVSDSGADWAEVGTNDPRARIHQQGGTILPKKGRFLRFQLNGRWVFARKVVMPARAFVGISGADREELLDLARDYVAEQARQ